MHLLWSIHIREIQISLSGIYETTWHFYPNWNNSLTVHRYYTASFKFVPIRCLANLHFTACNLLRTPKSGFVQKGPAATHRISPSFIIISGGGGGEKCMSDKQVQTALPIERRWLNAEECRSSSLYAAILFIGIEAESSQIHRSTFACSTRCGTVPD